METQHGYGVNQLETIGPDAIRVRVLLARVVPVKSALRRLVRKPRITNVPLEVARTVVPRN
jgi:hypothetical protein